MRLSTPDFEFLRKLLRERAAIALESDKMYMAEARLEALAQREGLSSISELILKVGAAGGEVLRNKLIEAMTTNETSFFRDFHPFEGIRRTLLPTMLKERHSPRSLRIWSAACSSGQEAYSIAMLIRDSFPELAGWDVRIVATDISSEMVERTRRGCYSQLEVNRGLPAAMLLKYFHRDGLEWTVVPEIRPMIDARLFNLASNWSFHEPFDIIMMRNVLIYFDVETKRKILARVARNLRPDIFLILGGAETTFNLDESFARIDLGRCGAYTLRPSGGSGLPGGVSSRPPELCVPGVLAASALPRSDAKGVS